jgi:hypothetical protein
MQPAQEVIRYPSLRALKTIAGARHELARLYFELKKGLIDPMIAGRLANILATMIHSTRDHEVEAKLAAMERLIDERLPAGKANGHAGHVGSARQGLYS